MAYFLFKCWHERLFQIRREAVIPRKAKTELTFLPVDESNASWVRELRGTVYEGQFCQQLSMGDFGYYACVNGKPVGYGWVKHPGSSDYFFKTDEGCCYLCRFFVHQSMRGLGIYPELICKLIERESKYDCFYIAVELGNESSERGLKKVGFTYVKECGFIRGFRHTFNKKQLTNG